MEEKFKVLLEEYRDESGRYLKKLTDTYLEDTTFEEREEVEIFLMENVFDINSYDNLLDARLCNKIIEICENVLMNKNIIEYFNEGCSPDIHDLNDGDQEKADWDEDDEYKLFSKPLGNYYWFNILRNIEFLKKNLTHIFYSGIYYTTFHDEEFHNFVRDVIELYYSYTRNQIVKSRHTKNVLLGSIQMNLEFTTSPKRKM